MGIKIDITEFEAFSKRLEQLEADQFDELIRSCAKILVQRLLAQAKENTPVDTGTLKGQWNVSNIGRVVKKGDQYEITVFNPIKYASYVEFGHRARNYNWVEGKHMLLLAQMDLETNSEALLTGKIESFLRKVFDD